MHTTGLRRFMFMTLASLCFSSGFSAATYADEGDEAPVTVTGELTVLYSDDFENHRAELSYVVKDAATNEHFTLRFKSRGPKNLKTGMIVTAKGKSKGKEIYLALDESGGGSIETIAPVGSAQGGGALPAAVIAGEQKTLVMVANFQDKSVACSNPAIADLMFTDPLGKSVDALYRETSHGNVWFTGQVVGPYPINYTSTGACDFDAWGNAIDSAALAAGVNLSAYTRKVYVMPQNSCPAAGIGNVGGSTTRAWIFHCDIPDVFAHELGHNLGMYHAATPTAEYGDSTDVMGLSQNKLRQINAPHKEQVGWLSEGRVQTVSQSGLYDVAPLQLDPSRALAPQTIKLVKADTNERYYLSYRRGIGFDAVLSSFRELDRLSVHRWDGAGKTYLLALLADGESFVDAVNGITVTQVGHTSEYSTARVELGSTPCSRNTPLISATPASQGGAAGTSLKYAVTVTNTDNLSCGSSVFSLQSTAPVGWNSSLSMPSLTLNPGQSGSLTLSVASPAGTVEGTYGASIAVSDTAAATHSASSTVNYVVQPSCTPAAPLVNISPASQSGAAGTTLSYAVTLTNRNSAGCGSNTFSFTRSVPSGWSGTFSQTSLTLSPGQSGTTTLSASSPVGALAGAYGLSVVASSTYTGSASASYTVEAAGDTQTPTAPTGLLAAQKRTQIQLTWSASSDNVGVTTYSVWRNSVRIGTTTVTSYSDTTAVSGTYYTYVVRAHDAAGNMSAASNSVTLTLGSTTVKGKK